MSVLGAYFNFKVLRCDTFLGRRLKKGDSYFEVRKNFPMNFQNFAIVPFQIHNYYIQLYSLKYPRTNSCFINCFIAFYLRQYMHFNLVMVRS